MTPQPQHPQRCDDLTTGIPPGVLWTYSYPWKVFRQSAGMGETEYQLFKDNQFFAQVNSSSDADEIIAWYSASHSSAGSQQRIDPLSPLDGFERAMQKFLEPHDPNYVIRERLHIELAEALGAIALLQAGGKE